MRGDGGFHLLTASVGGALGKLRLELGCFLLALCLLCGARLSKNGIFGKQHGSAKP
jgi:hypothetical protein